MLRRELCRYLDLDREDKIAASVSASDVGNAPAAKREGRSGLCSLGDREFFGSLKSGDLDFSSEYRIRNRNGNVAVDIVAVALEEIARTNVNNDYKITRRTSVTSVASLATKRNASAVINSRGNRYLKLFRNLYEARSSAILTRLFNDLTRSSATVAGRCALECHTAESLSNSALT